MIKGKMIRYAGSKIGKTPDIKPKNPQVLICTECPFADCIKGSCERYKKEMKRIRGKGNGTKGNKKGV